MDAPRTINGATVLQVADIADLMPTGRTRHVIGDSDAPPFAALAIAKFDSAPGYYLYYCDDDWNPLTDTYHASVEQAIAQAEFEFGSLNFYPPFDSRS